MGQPPPWRTRPALPCRHRRIPKVGTARPPSVKGPRRQPSRVRTRAQLMEGTSPGLTFDFSGFGSTSVWAQFHLGDPLLGGGSNPPAFSPAQLNCPTPTEGCGVAPWWERSTPPSPPSALALLSNTTGGSPTLASFWRGGHRLFVRVWLWSVRWGRWLLPWMSVEEGLRCGSSGGG